ncbi:hypothetical protein CNG02930 [Cryptococcus deneoformans JEC21]|uniref:Uncharacterized protein n=1 Tax=Cryptococcus deneoformans (strain JEC21 / ATCC MYA-565) TaxID=214684 RepID=A0A0S2M5U5_CRYD1|nr:hypothetical protein CNG02930 [Cryptococcus neoformans var. neoformans JEC21]ALO69294.1 hypothetical protein CNG02930 [Cryptococcus neoformans var. neoformans JEC21]
MPDTGKQKASNISRGALLDLKAITAEHVDRFAKEGRGPVKGLPRKQHIQKSRDPFNKPSPGLVKRLAAEARNDAKRRRFDDEGGPTEEERREILKAKAKKYEQIKKGDFSGLSQKEIEEAVIDFEKLEEFSDHSSDEDESAHPARLSWSDDEDEEDDDLAQVEYVDELGRTRTGTRKEAKEAERIRGRNEPVELIPSGAENSAYAEVQQSKVIHGEQHVFPVYEPNPEVIKAKYRQAEEEARAHHYDSTKEVRVKGAGQYQFSLDEQRRAEQQAALKSQRHETELARAEADRRGGITAAQEARKRKLEQRKAMIEAKRIQLFGGEKEVQILKEERRAREADEFLNTLQKEWEGQ